MSSHKTTTRVLLFLILIIVTASALSNQKRDGSNLVIQQVNRNEDKSDEYQGPVANYDRNYKTSTVTTSKEQELREARGSLYNKRAPLPLGELPPNFEGYGIHTDWRVGLPSLPVGQSDAIVVGKIVDAQAYLSNDKTAVYSEFTIHIEEILKNIAEATLNVGNSIIAEREGGVVKLKSGRLLPYFIFGQKMPRPGWTYVLFLNRNEKGEDFRILTGYKLHHNRVYPLDEGEQFIVYRDYDEQAFLNTLREAIVNTSHKKAGGM